MKDRFHTRLWRHAVNMTLAADSTHELIVVEGVRECPGCGLFQRLPRLAPGRVAACERCGRVLARRRRTSPIAAPAAFCIASAALYISLLVSTLMMLDVQGRENTVSLFSGPIELMRQGYGEVGLLVGWVTVVTPGLIIAMMSAILFGASRKHMPDWTPRLLRWYEMTREWSMIEVYILGVFVAYSKLVDLAHVDLLSGVYLVTALMFTMAATDSTLDEHRIWRTRDIREEVADEGGHSYSVTTINIARDPMPPVGHMLSCSACHLVMAFDHELPRETSNGHCPRCGHTLRCRKPFSQSNTLSFLIAALVFYVPANMFPVMTYSKVGQGEPSTIVHGAIELWQAGLIPLSLLVIFASIIVPVAKIFSLSLMIETTWFRSTRWLVPLTRIYRVVDIVGRWSMIDVFMISILVAVVRFGFMANVRADFGCVCFAAVVILTIFAAHTFDPRTMWDAAGLNGPVRGRQFNKTRQNGGAGALESKENMEPERA